MTALMSDLGTTYLASGSDLLDFDLWLSEPHGVWALDTETTGLNVRDPGFAVRQIAFGASDGSCFVFDGRDPDFIRQVLTLAVQSGHRWWAHNATYDALSIEAAYGLKLRGLRCSLVLTRTLDPRIIGTKGGSLKTLRPATQRALEALAEHWSRLSGKAVSAATEHSWLPDAVAGLPPNDPVLLTYVATDAVECSRLVEAWAEVSTSSLRKTANFEARIEDLWRWPAHRGYRVDTDRLAREIKTLTVVQAQGQATWGIDLTTASNATRQWVAERGIRITDRDGKDTLSHKHYDRAVVPEDARQDWSDFLRIREVSKTANKLHEIDRLVDAAGRIYPSIRGIGAHTGRMSIGKPALQNLPAPLRSLLMADAGMVLVGCDLDRVEPRVIAAVSGDTALAAAVLSDVYTELAVKVFGESARGDDSKRKVAKTAFLAMAYGQGRSSLAANLGITEDEAEAVLTGIKRGYPVMARWMAGIKRDARDGKPLTTVYGRPLPPTPEAPYRAVNWVIQGSAADLFKKITVDVAQRLGRDSLWLPVHDELIVQVPLGAEKRAMKALRKAMTTELLGVAITGTPLVIGSRWGKA